MGIAYLKPKSWFKNPTFDKNLKKLNKRYDLPSQG